MKSFYDFLRRIANLKSLILFFAIYMFFNGYILKNAEIKLNELAGTTVGVIDLSFGFDPQKTLDMVAAYGEEGRAFYVKTELTADLIYPIIYAFLFAIALIMLYGPIPNPFICFLPFITLLADYMENVFVVSLLKSYPQQSYNMAVFCEVFKLIKWSCFIGMLGLVLFGLVSISLKRLKLANRK